MNRFTFIVVWLSLPQILHANVLQCDLELSVNHTLQAGSLRRTDKVDAKTLKREKITRLSPLGNSFAYLLDDKVFVVNKNDSATKAIILPQNSVFLDFQYSADGLLYLLDIDSLISVYDADLRLVGTHKINYIFDTSTVIRASDFVIYRDSIRFVYQSSRAELVLITHDLKSNETDTLQYSPRKTWHKDPFIESFVLSGDGDDLYYTYQEERFPSRLRKVDRPVNVFRHTFERKAKTSWRDSWRHWIGSRENTEFEPPSTGTYSSRDYNYLVSGGDKLLAGTYLNRANSVTIWNREGDFVQNLRYEYAVNHLSFTHDGKYLAVTVVKDKSPDSNGISAINSIYIYDTARWELVETFDLPWSKLSFAANISGYPENPLKVLMSSTEALVLE